jgi:hypothetical protein
MPYDLFISYARKDNQDLVRHVITYLENRYREETGETLECYLDEKSIEGMDDMRDRIRGGLRESP